MGPALKVWLSPGARWPLSQPLATFPRVPCALRGTCYEPLCRTREGGVPFPGEWGAHAPGLCQALPWDVVLWQPTRHIPLLLRGLRSDEETDNTCTHELTCPVAKATVKTSQADMGGE